MGWPGIAWAQNGQNALRPAGEQALGIELLWWSMFWVGSAIFVAVMFLLAWALWRGRGRSGSGTQGLDYQASRTLVLAAGVAIPLLILLTLIGGSLLLGRSIAAEPPPGALHIRVTGWMWWWEVEYLDDRGQVVAVTANEIHVPVGRPVAVELASADVIHSFWVPNLHGKTDLVPGKVNDLWFTAQQPGVYRGQCAEFCGAQHALMAFLVVAEAPEDFNAWLQRQGEPARAPQAPTARHGLEVFIQAGCADCHTIRGTPAEGDKGPDLSHMASRRSLAAGTLPNSRGHLGGWISDPQSVKPGAFMPRTLMEPADLKALISYLESLR